MNCHPCALAPAYPANLQEYSDIQAGFATSAHASRLLLLLTITLLGGLVADFLLATQAARFARAIWPEERVAYLQDQERDYDDVDDQKDDAEL
jgi:hypothetical protein